MVGVAIQGITSSTTVGGGVLAIACRDLNVGVSFTMFNICRATSPRGITGNTPSIKYTSSAVVMVRSEGKKYLLESFFKIRYFSQTHHTELT